MKRLEEEKVELRLQLMEEKLKNKQLQQQIKAGKARGNRDVDRLQHESFRREQQSADGELQ